MDTYTIWTKIRNTHKLTYINILISLTGLFVLVKCLTIPEVAEDPRLIIMSIFALIGCICQMCYLRIYSQYKLLEIAHQLSSVTLKIPDTFFGRRLAKKLNINPPAVNSATYTTGKVCVDGLNWIERFVYVQYILIPKDK